MTTDSRETAPVGEKTLRDEFAMAAVTGFLANESGPPVGTDHPNGTAGVAHAAYMVADAMLAERAKALGASHG